MSEQIKWDWWGTWVIDWLTCDRGDFSSDAWISFDIWKKAYLEACPEFAEATDLELIESHYCPAMEPIFNSWVFAFYLALQWPANIVRSTAWMVKRQFS